MTARKTTRSRPRKDTEPGHRQVVARRATRKRVDPEARARAELRLQLAAMGDTRGNAGSSWVCAAPSSDNEQTRLLPKRSQAQHSSAPGRGRAGTSAALNQ